MQHTETATGRTPLISRAAFLQVRYWSTRQWAVAGVVGVVAFVLIGEIGETLPNVSAGRTYPVEWWNYATLVLSAVLLGLIAATFTLPSRRRAAAGAGSGVAGAAAAVAMACPVCSPLAIPLLGTGGLLAFAAPLRGWIALFSVVLLGVTLLLRLRAASTCQWKPARVEGRQ